MQTFSHTYRMPVWAILWATLLGNLLGLFACLALPNLAAFLKSQGPMIFVRIGLMMLAVDLAFSWFIIWIWSVKVGSGGIRGFDFWGVFRTVEWADMNRTKTFNFCGLKFVRVFHKAAPLWIPLFLVKQAEFVQTVTQYAPGSNPLRQHFEASRTKA